MVKLGNFRMDIDLSTEEDMEEVVRSVGISAKKQTVEEDQWLIRAWINISMDAIVGTDQKKSSFCGRMAFNLNNHYTRGLDTHLEDI